MALVVIPLSMVLVMVVVKKSQRYFKAQQKSLGQVNGHIEEMYAAHTIVKAFNGEEDSLKTFKVFPKTGIKKVNHAVGADIRIVYHIQWRLVKL